VRSSFRAHPLAGAVYILTPDRVHPLDVSFTHAIEIIAKWGSGSKELIAAMKANEAMAAGKAVTSPPLPR
jgi:hypothetical protein